MQEKKVKEKVKALISNYSIEKGYYEVMIEKLQEEFEIIKSGKDLSGALRILGEKNMIMSKIGAIETVNAPLKNDYNDAKKDMHFSSKELDRVLVKLSFLIGELITLQERNAAALGESMGAMKVKMNNIKKSGMLSSRYRKYSDEPVFVEKMR